MKTLKLLKMEKPVIKGQMGHMESYGVIWSHMIPEKK